MKLPEHDEARRLREFFLRSGYTSDGISAAFGGLNPPVPGAEPGVGEAPEGPPELWLLGRLFFLGQSLSRAEAEAALPSWFLDLAASCGLLEVDESVRPLILIAPHENLLVASDLYARLQSQESDHVLAVNPVARHLLNFTIREPVRSCLDLCAGSGIQALAAASHSERVVATDLNARAVEFARFNQRLNGIDHVDCRAGSGYDCVQGEKFDLIVCNPPFVLTPSTRFLYRDNPMELDLFCRQLVREAPPHLEDGAYFQMICEWVEVKGQSWQERLGEWFRGTGCDAWVLKANTLRPESYARRRREETEALEGEGVATLEEWLEYYREREVQAIHGGLIALRARPGENWARFEEIRSDLDQPFGETILRGFRARDLLESSSDDAALLELCLRLVEEVHLEKTSVWADGRWKTTARLRLDRLGRNLGLEESMADFLTRFDGRRSLGELADELRERVPVEEAAVLSVVRAFIEQGVLIP